MLRPVAASDSTLGSPRQRWRGAWLVVLALIVAPALTPVTQRLGFSVTQRAAISKRSVNPPKKADVAPLVQLAVSPFPRPEVNADTRRHVLRPVDDILETLEILRRPDSLRAPPATLSL